MPQFRSGFTAGGRKVGSIRSPFISAHLFRAPIFTFIAAVIPTSAAFGDEGRGETRARQLSAARIKARLDAEVSAAAFISEDASPIRAGCDVECSIAHLDGSIPLHPPVVASPVGSTYSVHHMLGADMDDAGPDGITCVRIFDPDSQLDDIVEFDSIAENIRPDILGTTATVSEIHEIQTDGSRFIQINTTAPNGTDLFPSGQFSEGHALTDACFAIGLDDPLDWDGLDGVILAVIRFFHDGQVIIGPFDVTNLFTDPWNGALNLTLPGGAGLGINGVQLEIRVEKLVQVPNDNCANPISVTDGTMAFSNIGATTDGIAHPLTCSENSYSDIGSDVWFRYTATCTGQLTVDLCNSTYDTKVAVYNGCGRCPVESEPIACNDDFCSLRSFAQVAVTQGHCYLIRVGGYQGAQGQGSLRLECDAPTETGACCLDDVCAQTTNEPTCLGLDGDWFEGETCPGFACPGAVPPNDACDDAIRIFTGIPYNGSTVNATGSDISSCEQGDTADVWHFWTADCTGLLDVDTSGSSFDTSLAAFNACGGTQLACDEDQGTGLTAKIRNLQVTQGTSYYFRVAGRLGTVGTYQIFINPCRNACCQPNGGCSVISAAQCNAGGGDPQNPGTLCLGDNDDNGVDDACDSCPNDVTIVNADPFSGTIDARQPHAPDMQLPRQGIGSPGDIGSPAEPIRVLLIPRLAELENCFEVCETVEDPILGANAITSVSYLGNGIYELDLSHAISAGGVTTIEFTGNGSFAQFTAHPGNVNADAAANSTDVTKLIDCCLNAICTAPYGMRSCDSDRSTRIGPLDILNQVDLLNGSTEWTPWNNTARPSNTSCPP